MDKEIKFLETKVKNPKPRYVAILKLDDENKSVSYIRIFDKAIKHIFSILQTLEKQFNVNPERKLCLTELSKLAKVPSSYLKELVVIMASMKRLVKVTSSGKTTTLFQSPINIQQEIIYKDGHNMRMPPLYVFLAGKDYLTKSTQLKQELSNIKA